MDIEQIDVLKNGFDGLDKENTGQISATGMQMIYKMIGLSVQVSFILLEKMIRSDNFFVVTYHFLLITLHSNYLESSFGGGCN